ncbi:sigma factor-like helix-turn-helix DNA-binding protein [Actinacidiphila paucisporea]|uniref:sigma factor-like helix-turn-helix DNA-binding protein n=1 Tax=Actinacidiphila paucisporea TaxID=310782 RepID=UPI000937B4A9|nr:sigma factor-like helix-turn-helix DNA-binding protein [Actinacidiphila paucisporea]
MGKRRAAAEIRRDAEFAAFTAGAAGRLLHTATLLTGDREQAERLLTATLARTYADWLRMGAEDPYDQARAELVRRFAGRPWWRRPRGGVLARLTPQERLVVTMRYFEGVAEEQTAAQLGLATDRVRAICARAAATLRSHRYDPAGPAPPAAEGAQGAPLPGRRGEPPRTVAEARDRADRAARPPAGQVAP